MTYRKLHHWIFLGSTLVLMVVWGFSLTAKRGISWIAPGRQLDVSISRGSLFVEQRTDDRVIPPHHSFRSLKERVQWRSLDSFGQWDWHRYRGSFGFHAAPAPGSHASPTVVTGSTITHRLVTPLWAWWMGFVGLAYGICRRLEKRAASAQEGTLAGDSTPDRLSGDAATEKSPASLAMTHRRLFVILLVATTLTTSVMWLRSLHSRSRFTFSPDAVPFTVLAHLKLGTITAEWHSQKGLPPRYSYDPLRTGWNGNWMGRFGLERVDTRPRSGHAFTITRVDFPIWLPWLLFNGGAFVLLRLLEQRSSRGKEMQLAERAGE